MRKIVIEPCNMIMLNHDMAVPTDTKNIRRTGMESIKNLPDMINRLKTSCDNPTGALTRNVLPDPVNQARPFPSGQR